MSTSREGRNSQWGTTATQVVRPTCILLGGLVLTNFFRVSSRPERSNLLFNHDMTDIIV